MNHYQLDNDPTDEESQNLLFHPTTSRSRSTTPVSLLRAWLLLRLRGLRLRRPVRHTVPPLLLLAAKALTAAVLLVLTLTPFFAPSYTHLPPHYQQLAKNCAGPSPTPGCANPHNEKVFIATILYDKHGTLAGGKWGERVLALIQLLGPENVFLSIYENDSGLVGQAALNDFEQRVPCKHKIVFDSHVSLSEFSNITLPDGTQRTKRVAWLSELRNRALRPLDRFTGEEENDTDGIGSTKFDKVLFLNDIVFQPMDGAHLLFDTNRYADGQADYVAACALDWFRPFRIYDIYALRDAEGFANYQTVYPFFQRNGKAASRADILAQTDAVRVRSCWGGMMAMQARYVQNLDRLPPSPAFETVGGHVVDPDRPRNITAPVRFRHEPEAYYDACECCLFSADLALVAKNEGVQAGIVVNPYIRVAYSEKILRWLPIARRWERLLFLTFEFQSWFMPAAENPYRAVEQGETFEEEVWEGGGWKIKKRAGRNGLFCGVRDMQLLQREGKRPGESGSNWVNTKMPPGQTLKFKSWWGEILPGTWRNDWTKASSAEQDAFFELPSGPGA